MRWKNSPLGWLAFRLAYAGFLALCWLSQLSGQELLQPVEIEAPVAAQYPAGATLTEKLTIMLESWTTWYLVTYLSWSETDRRWKSELLISWKNLKDSLQKQEQETAALRLENSLLRQQIKDMQPVPWITGAAGAGAGLIIGLLIQK